MNEKPMKNSISEKIQGFGTNNLDAISLYVTRKRYKEEVMKYGIKPIDMWFDKLNYGKVDKEGNPIFISESNLKPLKTSETILVADFVADAYEDFREYISRAILTKKIIFQGETFLKKLIPKKDGLVLNSCILTTLIIYIKYF